MIGVDAAFGRVPGAVVCKRECMEMLTLAVEVPEEVVALLGSPEAAAARARQALMIELLREGRISQGKAAEALGLSRWAMLDLMAAHRVESGPASDPELQQDLDVARRASTGTTRGSRQ
jgi:predicted HTH domain antitoxin